MRALRTSARAALLASCLGFVACASERDDETPIEPETCPPSSPTAHFDTDIQSDIDSMGCSAAMCHGGGMGGMRLVAKATGDELTSNHEAFKARAAKGAASLVLRKPSGAEAHTGGKMFEEGDATYDRWLTWIEECAPR